LNNEAEKAIMGIFTMIIVFREGVDMNTIVKFLLPVALFILLGGCRMADLSYGKGEISLQVDEKYMTVKGTTLSRHMDNFGKLFLVQKVVKLKSGNIVVYERARTDDLFEFNLTPIQTIKVIFDARNVISVYYKSSFHLLQLILSDGRVLNIAVEQFDDQRLSFVYGMSTKQFRSILKRLDPQAAGIPLIEKVIILPQGSSAILSRWSVQKVQLVPLIIPLRYLFGL
jgi:hypothetical protein